MTEASVAHTENLQSLLKILELEIPAYLKPFSSLETHGPSLMSLDSSAATGMAERAVAESKRRIIHTCEKIVALLQGPTVKLTIDASGHLTSAAISIAVKLRLPHLISSNVNTPTTLDELVKATSASPDLLTRILRYLTQRFIFAEPSPSSYVQNTMSKALAEPVTEAWIDLIATEYHRGSAALMDLLLEHQFQIPSESHPTALTKAFGSEQSFYDYMRLVNPDLGRKYALSMSAPSNGPHTSYPYAQLPAGSCVVDVGGGSGHITAPLAQQYRNLEFIVQDSASTIAYGKSVYESAGLPINWQTVNFFEDQPVKGARVYLLRHILIDHPDRTSLQILNCIANAMSKDSRLLIADAIVPDQYGEESDSLINVLDLHLLCMFNSKERSLKQWNELLASVGKPLEIVKVWISDDPVAHQEALLEIKLKE